MSMYVRCKRDTRTWFIQCESHDCAGTVRDEIARIQDMNGEDIQLYREDEVVLAPSLELGEQDVKSSNLIYVVFKTPEGAWEPICVKRPVYIPQSNIDAGSCSSGGLKGEEP